MWVSAFETGGGVLRRGTDDVAAECSERVRFREVKEPDVEPFDAARLALGEVIAQLAGVADGERLADAGRAESLLRHRGDRSPILLRRYEPDHLVRGHSRRTGK